MKYFKKGRVYLTKDSFPVLCEDTKELCYTYSEYLKSNHWHNLRLRYYASKLFTKNKRFPSGCHCCGFTGNLELHHRTYKYIGKERLQDLIPLCRRCHQDTHDLVHEMKSVAKNDWKILKSKSWRKVRNLRKKDLKTNYPYR
jgi:hypothetical protein